MRKWLAALGSMALVLILCTGLIGAIAEVCAEHQKTCENIFDPQPNPTSRPTEVTGCDRAGSSVQGRIPVLPPNYVVKINPCWTIAKLPSLVLKLFQSRQGSNSRFIRAVQKFADAVAATESLAECAYESSLLAIVVYYPQDSPDEMSVLPLFDGSLSAFEDTSKCFLRSLLISHRPGLPRTVTVAAMRAAPGRPGCLDETIRHAGSSAWSMIWLATDSMCPMMTGQLRWPIGTVNTQGTRLRSAPGRDPVLATMNAGVTVGMTCRANNDWIKVRYLNLAGYVSAGLLDTAGVNLQQCVDFGGRQVATVALTGLRLRAKPARNSVQLAEVQAGTEVLVGCYANGDSVTGWGGTSTRWDLVRLNASTAGYMADVWLDTTGINIIACSSLAEPGTETGGGGTRTPSPSTKPAPTLKPS
jgi:hypothetical protein